MKARKLRNVKGYIEKRLEQHEQPKKKQCVTSIDSNGCAMWSPSCPTYVVLECMQTNKMRTLGIGFRERHVSTN